MNQKNQKRSNYSAQNIQVLEGLEAVRKRPAMYIGDIGTRGLHHLVWEVVDNAVDESLAGFCTEVNITVHPDHAITVSDNGRGIPVDIHPKVKKPTLEVVMTVLHAGGKFDKDAYQVSGGLHGVGVSCVNALSGYLKATIHRDGKSYEQTYSKGIPTSQVEEVGNSSQRGTTIYFRPDETIFTTTTYQYDTIVGRLRELAFLNPGLRLQLTDMRTTQEDGSYKQDIFFSEGGLNEFVTFIDSSRDSILPAPITVTGKKNGVIVEVAFTYNTGYSENLVSYVNNINTIEGGTHVGGFRRAITRTLKSYAETSGALEKVKITIVGDDFREGITAVIATKVPEPQFEGQTKTKLGNAEVTGIVDKAVSDALQVYLEEHPKQAKTILSKVIAAAQARHAARKARDMIRSKTTIKTTSLPGKLAPCINTNPEESEIFLTEGQSASGTAKQGRNRHTQAILSLRGKILNVDKTQEYKIYENEELKNIIISLGVTFGTDEDQRAVNMEKLRYHKIIIMTDADVDGKHISTLILTFFFRYMPDLFQQGYVYLAQPPLYLVKKGNEKHYCWNEEEQAQLIAMLEVKPGKGNITIQRYKGLGEMNADQLWNTTLNPETRKLKQVTVESAAEADRLFSMLMGGDVPPRRAFIQNHAQYAELDV
ncbi:MAG: DNA topoisomerase (ATP-hydrolyzing) subunit B [Bacteroidota bacterium]